MKNKMTKYFVLTIALSFFLPKLSHAESSTGCGLGWQVTKSMTTSAAGTRATTNVTSSNTFGMTSGTSGCAKHSIVQNEKMDMHFTEANFEFLTAEAAIGGGEYLSGWARSQGCTDAVENEFKTEVQKNFIQIFGNNQNYSQSLSSLKKVIKNNPNLSRFCNYRS